MIKSLFLIVFFVFASIGVTDQNLPISEEVQVATPTLALYHTPWCYYCQKVIKYLDRIHKTVPLKDVDYLCNKEELKKIGGKSQVPCLVIDGQALYESNDIIAWLSANQNKLENQ